jgi:hypothetical protein
MTRAASLMLVLMKSGNFATRDALRKEEKKRG